MPLKRLEAHCVVFVVLRRQESKGGKKKGRQLNDPASILQCIFYRVTGRHIHSSHRDGKESFIIFQNPYGLRVERQVE